MSNGGLTESPEGGTECSFELWGAAEDWELLGAQIRLDWARDPKPKIQLARNVNDRRAGAKAEEQTRSSNLGRYADGKT